MRNIKVTENVLIAAHPDCPLIKEFKLIHRKGCFLRGFVFPLLTQYKE